MQNDLEQEYAELQEELSKRSIIRKLAASELVKKIKRLKELSYYFGRLEGENYNKEKEVK